MTRTFLLAATVAVLSVVANAQPSGSVRAATDCDRLAQPPRASMGTVGGPSRDKREAVRLYRLAAADGFADAQYDMGAMYEAGHGSLPQDRMEAARFYRLAATQGHPEAAKAVARLGNTPNGPAATPR